MTEPKWTPGPLDCLFIGANASGAHHTYIIDGKGRKIGVCWGGSDEKDANGYLWSAAPDLYAALEIVSGMDLHHEVLAIVDAAMRKAMGE